MIEELTSHIDRSLFVRSGKVFYSGLSAFTRQAEIYILGLNPGGDPFDGDEEVIERNIYRILHTTPAAWSAYADESWKSRPPGTHGMQPRILHLFRQIERDVRATPASNLVFVRSRRENDIKDQMHELAETCWPFHAKVISRLKPRVILCLGRTVGKYVREKLSANEKIGQFTEENERRWVSTSYRNEAKTMVVTVSHPSIADWTKIVTDPSNLVRSALDSTVTP